MFWSNEKICGRSSRVSIIVEKNIVGSGVDQRVLCMFSLNIHIHMSHAPGLFVCNKIISDGVEGEPYSECA